MSVNSKIATQSSWYLSQTARVFKDTTKIILRLVWKFDTIKSLEDLP